MTTRYTLYRMFDADDDLLYVGITNSPSGRFAEHSFAKAWWPRVVRISVEHYPNREEAVQAERDAITAGNPVYNVQGREIDWWLRDHIDDELMHYALRRMDEECVEGQHLDVFYAFYNEGRKSQAWRPFKEVQTEESA